MPRYVDAEKIRPFKGLFEADFNVPKFYDWLETIPTADVVERKRGKWKHGYCSECGYNWGKDAPIANVPNFCPNCGAVMDEGSEDGEIHNC